MIDKITRKQICSIVYPVSAGVALLVTTYSKILRRGLFSSAPPNKV